MKLNKKSARGFTLIEILVVIGIIAVLATIVIIAINPTRQFAQARNSQRTSNVNAILNAIGQRMADNKGLFRESTDTVCTSAMDLPIPSAVATTSLASKNIRPCLVPTYIPDLPHDPASPNANNTCVDSTPGDCNAGSYNTEYTVSRDSTGRVTVCANYGSEPSIKGSTAICVTR